MNISNGNGIYYGRIIRDENELGAIREYIAENPLKWESDKENPNKSRIQEDVRLDS